MPGLFRLILSRLGCFEEGKGMLWHGTHHDEVGGSWCGVIIDMFGAKFPGCLVGRKNNCIVKVSGSFNIARQAPQLPQSHKTGNNYAGMTLLYIKTQHFGARSCSVVVAF